MPTNLARTLEAERRQAAHRLLPHLTRKHPVLGDLECVVCGSRGHGEVQHARGCAAAAFEKAVKGGDDAEG